MPEYIEREAKKTCRDCDKYEVCKRIDYELEYKNKSEAEAIVELVEHCRFFKNKSDVVEVVRCKECKKCERLYPEKEIGKEPQPEYFCRLDSSLVTPNHFCGYGERREKNEK